MKVKAEVVEEKVEKEIHKYEAFDGTIFESIRKCADYDLENKFEKIHNYYIINSREELIELIEDKAILLNKASYNVILTGEKQISSVVRNNGIARYYYEDNHLFYEYEYDTSTITFPALIKVEYEDYIDGPINIMLSTIDYDIKNAVEKINNLTDFVNRAEEIKELVKNG